MEVSFNILQVNSMSDEKFEEVFGNVIELCKAAPVWVKNMRPFKDMDDLCAAFHKYLDEITIESR